MSNAWVPKKFEKDFVSGDDIAKQLLGEQEKVFKDIGFKQADVQIRPKQNQMVICAGCGKQATGRIAVAMGQKYHYECFECSQCARPIKSDGFTLRKGQPWCQACVDWANKEKPLHQVGKPKPKVRMKPAGKPNKVIKKTVIREGKGGAAGSDFMKGFKAKACAVCFKNIKIGVDYAGQSFCMTCFRCCDCGEVIDSSQGFQPNGNRARCSNCASRKSKKQMKSCTACGKNLVGKFISVEGSPFHKACFKCSDCKGSVANGYLKQGNKYLCAGCVNRANLPPKPKRTGAKFCTSCGSEDRNGSKYCTNCGEEL